MCACLCVCMCVCVCVCVCVCTVCVFVCAFRYIIYSLNGNDALTRIIRHVLMHHHDGIAHAKQCVRDLQMLCRT